MPSTAARAVLRPFRFSLRPSQSRTASTTSEAANAAASGATKAKDGASQASSKASQGLSKVTASTSSTLSRAGPAISNSLGKVGGRTGRVISAVGSLYPPIKYYSQVGLEMSKMVFHGQRMTPPTMAQFQSYFQPLTNAIRNPSSLFSQNPGLLRNPQLYLNQVRNLSRQQWFGAGLIAAEVLGFFTVGEMIGKFKVIGYRGKGPAGEHH